MTEDQIKLWLHIKNFELDQNDVSFNFTNRLARENGWSIEYCVRAILEYKKFMFLLVNSDCPLTPSDQVDQVWHLHLLYTQSYWDHFCDKTLCKKIHHGPTNGGGNEREKFTNWYEKTKTFYLEIFKNEPPIDIWPSNDIRFSEINFERVNKDKYWTIKKMF